MKMRSLVTYFVTLVLCAVSLAPPVLFSQEGPQSPSSDTVAKPRNKPAPDNGEQQPSQPQDQEKIPSQYKRQPTPDQAAETPTFRADATTVTVPVAVLDPKGRFIPNIPQNYFRVLEDGTPQQISGFAKGEAPMTVCMLIEFSGLFQAYWSYG